MQKFASILYFEIEGRENLPQVLRVVKKAMKKRSEVRALPIVIFTATGEGPALAYAQLHEFDSRIIAVTFPPDFSVMRGQEKFSPRIPDKLAAFFDGVGLKVITGRLPFDRIEGLQAHNEQMQLVQKTLSMFGGGFDLSIQAVLAACDAGEIRLGERVLAITGDTASIITASTTQKFLTKDAGIIVSEILCKPRALTVSRGSAPTVVNAASKTLDVNSLTNKVINVRALAEKNPRKPE